jgi:2-methylcitrate dehydratase PrpD
MNSYTARLADYISETKYEDLPKEVVSKIKLFIIDCMANMVGGAKLEPARIVQELFSQYGGTEEATVFSTGKKLPVPNATYINSFLANVLDFDDTYHNFAHPGAAVIPAALAIAEKKGASGKELITAIVLGYEISLRIGHAIMPSKERRDQVWGFATWQAFGAAVSAAKLLGLNGEQIRDAFGHVGMSAPVPSIRKLGMEQTERPFTWLKNNYGWASMAGVIAAELASRNFRGNGSILDGDHGFWIMAGSDQCDFKALTKELGSTFLCLDTSFKPYAACRWAHASIDGARIIREKHQLRIDEVDSVRVSTYGEAKRSLSEVHPNNIIDAQFSLPYLIALELCNKSSAKGLQESDLKDSVIYHFSESVFIDVNEDFDSDFVQNGEMKAHVEIVLKNGKCVSEMVEVPKGDPQNPLTEQEIKEKFVHLVHTETQQEREMLKELEKLEEVDDIDRLFHSWNSSSS